ncbi:MAG: hypothetical protein WD595_05785, partial [Waddliaceae bacterium]
GCCGMAGSFGYEAEHAEISRNIGELVLLPHIRKANHPVISSGFSCRSQILLGTGRRSIHLAEFLNTLL